MQVSQEEFDRFVQLGLFLLSASQRLVLLSELLRSERVLHRFSLGLEW